MTTQDLLAVCPDAKPAQELIGPSDPNTKLYVRFPKVGARSERYYVTNDKVATIVVFYGPGTDYNSIVAKLSEDNGGPTTKMNTSGVTSSTWIRNSSVINFMRVGSGSTQIPLPFGGPIKLQPNAAVLVITGK